MMWFMFEIKLKYFIGLDFELINGRSYILIGVFIDN